MLPSFILLGLLSMLFAEVASGASQVWYLNPIGIALTFGLYLSHIVILWNFAIKTSRTQISSLYFWGVVFGLYESWITKVLWAGYINESSPGMGLIAGVGIAEYVALVLFYHPIMSFILPLLAYQVITGVCLERHQHLLKPTKTKYILLSAYISALGFFVAKGNNYNLVTANAAIIGTAALIWITTKRSPLSLDRLIVSSKAMPYFIVYLITLYIGSFCLILPNRIPSTFTPFLTIVSSYIIAGLFLYNSKPIQLQISNREENIISQKSLRSFLLLFLLSTNIAIFTRGISMFVLMPTYLGMMGAGLYCTYKFAKDVIKKN